MSTSIVKRIIVFIAVVTFTHTSSLIASELDELQGKWEFRLQENNRNLRVVKTIRDNTETVESFEGNQLVHKHIVTIEVVETDGVVIIKYGESEITEGPRKGQKGTPGAFLSKRLAKSWYNVSGLLASEEFPPSLLKFTRVEN